jgi:hypothetical protein
MIPRPTKMRQGSAAWRGMRDAGAAADAFLLIFADPKVNS